jgi:hypothetical protein
MGEFFFISIIDENELNMLNDTKKDNFLYETGFFV